MGIAQKYRPHYTYEDYCQWEGKWELIEGMPYAMSPAPNAQHQWIASQLSALFINALTGCKKCRVYQPVDWKISDDTVLQPDLSIVCRPFNNNIYLDFPPVLIVEILSPSTAQKDRREKFDIYENQGVKYYILVNPTLNKIEIFGLTEKNYQAVSVNPSSFNFQLDDCSASINFEGLFKD